MIGLEFNIDKNINNILKLIFQNINMNIYDWYILENEVMNNFELNKKYDSGISGKKMLEIINIEEFFVYFINLQAFKNNKKYICINNYEDFLNSGCQIIILISDGYVVEIYCKDNDICEQIYNKFISNKSIINLKYKTLNNDGRVNMHIN